MRKWPWLALFALSGCVSMEPEAPSKTVVRAGQRTLLLVFAPPGPWVTANPDSKAESAAKFLPGVGDVVQSAQDDRDLAASQQLLPYLSYWKPVPLFTAHLSTALAQIDYPGTWLAPGPETETGPEVLRRFNTAADALEWRKRYYDGSPAEARAWRNYAQLLSLDDALILEVNLLPGLIGNDERTYVPGLKAQCRLFRGGTLRLLWSREELVEESSNPRTLYEYMNQPGALAARYEQAFPSLAQKIASSLRASVQAQAVLTDPVKAPPPPPAAPAAP